MEKRSGVVAALLVILGAPLVVGAQPRKPTKPTIPAPSASSSSPAAPAAPAVNANLEAAKDFFRKGNAELEAGRNDRALDYFLKSRALVPSVANTNNAALALENLGRIDEALDLYEELLLTFATRLSSDERTSVSNKVAKLRGMVGQIEVSANVDGLLVIDGRRRGNVPAAAPFRVPAGSHSVRVIKDGHTPAEVTLTVAAGQSVRADLKLEVLSAAGRLSVTDTSGAPDVEVLIDGAPLGVAPWEGTLGPGRHLVALRGKDTGTAPTAVTVLAGQTVRSELRSVRLGPRLNVMFEPATAIVSIDGVEVGPGRWQGRLPDGEHTFEAREEGYLPAEERIGIDRTELSVQLKVNEGHPRWRQAGGKWQLGAVLGLSFASGLGSRAEEACPANCPRAPGAEGGLVAGRLSYHLRNGLFFEGLVGVLQVERSFRRKVENSVGRYTLDDQLSLRGPVVQLGVGYQLPLSARLRGVGGLGVGFFSAKANDPVTGQLEAGGSTTPITVEQSGKSVRGAAIYLAPRLGVDLNVSRRLRLGLGLSAMIFLLDGPSFPHGETTPTTPDCSQGRTSASCARGTIAFSSERSYSRFVLWTPQASLGWEFLAMLTRFMAMPKRSRSRAAWPLSLLGVTLATTAPGLADPSPQAAPRDDAALASLRERFPRELGRRPEVPLRLGLRALSSQRFALTAGPLAVEASLLGARDVAAQRDGDLVSFRGAAPGGGDLLVRAGGGALEDFLSLPQPLATPEVRYELRLDGVAGLRLVSNTLEFLDATGTPQLHVAPPYLIDAHNHTHPATLSVEQCDVDLDSRPPWGRPTTPPGAGTCVLRVAWSDHGVAYPALLDPSWEVTNDPVANHLHMITARTLPALAPFGDRVVVIGGLTGKVANPATTDQVEYFDPATRTFAQGPALPGPRYGHTATPLPGGSVLVTGGFAQPQPPHVATSGNPAALSDVLILEPGATKWKVGPPLGAPRGFHTATVIEGGRVLVLGGLDQKQSSPLAESYDPFTGKWNGVAPMPVTNSAKPVGRHMHTATLLPDGRVLVAGGLAQTPTDSGAGGPVTGQNTALLFQPLGASGSPWKPTVQLTQGRAGHSAHLLRNGQVVLAGGCSSAPSFANSDAGCVPIDELSVFKPSSEQGSWTALAGPPPLPTAPSENPSPLSLAGPSVAGLRNGWLLLVGGRDGDQDDLRVTAVLRPQKATDTTVGDPSGPVADWQWAYNPFERGGGFASRSFAAVIIDQSGSVLRLGGLSGNDITKDAQYLPFLPDSEKCTQDKAIECGSGVCVSGFCCDRLCDGPCESCLQSETNLSKNGLCGARAIQEGKGCKQVTQCQTTGPSTQSVDRGVCHNGVCLDAPQECISYQACNAQAEAPSCSEQCDSAARCAQGLFCQPKLGQLGAMICCDTTCASASCDQAGVGLLVGACDPLTHTCETDYDYCKGYACDPVNKDCRTTCSDNSQCAKSTHFCNQAGQCVPQKPGGSACKQDPECSSGSCIDEICCNKTCEPTCRSCAQKVHGGNDGACLPVPDNDKHNDDCPADTTNACGFTGLCSQGKCALAGDDVPCGEISARQCINNDLRSLYCNGQGQCGTSQQDKPCPLFSCLDGACRKVCSSTPDCIDDNECIKQVCVSPVPLRCQGENQVVQACVEGTCNPEVTRPCEGGFACSKQGLCPTKCSDDSGCRDGFTCDAKSTCAPIATCIEGTNKIQLANGQEQDCLPNHRCTSERPDRCTQANCLSSDDCQETFVCHDSGRCLPAARPSLDDADCLCSQPGRPSPLAPGAVALLLAAAALRRRSRRAGS